MNPNTSAAVTSAGALPTTPKNTFKSKAVANTVFGRHRPATNSKYSSSSGTPRPTSGRPAASTDLIRGGSTTAMRAPHLHERRATTARRNVHEDHPHIKQMIAFRRARSGRPPASRASPFGEVVGCPASNSSSHRGGLLTCRPSTSCLVSATCRHPQTSTLPGAREQYEQPSGQDSDELADLPRPGPATCRHPKRRRCRGAGEQLEQRFAPDFDEPAWLPQPVSATLPACPTLRQTVSRVPPASSFRRGWVGILMSRPSRRTGVGHCPSCTSR